MPNITIFENDELITIDEAVFKVQRDQLARMDLKLLCKQSIDLALLTDERELNERLVAFNLTLGRITHNLVAGAVAVAKLDNLTRA